MIVKIIHSWLRSESKKKKKISLEIGRQDEKRKRTNANDFIRLPTSLIPLLTLIEPRSTFMNKKNIYTYV